MWVDVFIGLSRRFVNICKQLTLNAELMDENKD